MNIFFILPITEIIIIIYCFGTGLLLNKKILNNNISINNYSEICIYGFFLTLLFAQVINFITPLKEIYFWFFFSFSIFNIYKNRFLINNFFNWLLKISVVFFILTPFKMVIKGHDDIYYHLPKLNFINNQKIIFGISNYYESFAFTNGWSHVGSFFNFFFGSEKNIYLVTFVFFVLVINTLYIYFKKSDNNNIKTFCLVSISFLCIKFYRLQEFGNDFQTILILFIIFNLYFISIKKNNNDFDLIKKIFIYSTFATLFKIHGILINLFLLIYIFQFKKFCNKNFFKVYLFILLSYLLTFMTSFINSGCILFPFKNTCFESNVVSWSTKEYINNTYLEAYNKSYEKKYLNNQINRMSYEEWLKDFNWFKFHFKSKNFYEPFFKSIVIVLLLFFLLVKFINFKIQSIEKKNLIFLILSFFIILIWTIKIPLMRASGYGYIICTLIFFFLSLIKITFIRNLKKLTVFFVILIFIPLLLNNSYRIYKEINKYKTTDIFFFTKKYGEDGNLSIYKNLELIDGRHDKRGKKLIIEKKFTYFFIKR